MTTWQLGARVAKPRSEALTAAGAWVRKNNMGFTFVASLVLGLLFLAAAAFTVSLFAGLLVTGLGLLGGGHWVTYLRTTGAGDSR